MPTYSHSKLGTFETCKLQYKFSYIDKLKVPQEDTVETFLGSRAHEALEKLYKDLKFQKLLSLKELLAYYNKLWKENWNDTVKINKKEYSEENYRLMGEKYLADYYKRYKPFDQGKVLGLETLDFLDLGKGYKFHVRIDRLVDIGNGVYEVHDYKTNNSLPKQEKLDEDRQLAMYSLWVKNQFKDLKKVRLVWHFLAFDREMESSRTASELEDLKKDVLKKIKEIENSKKFPANKTALCDWCNFQSICPLFKHEFELEEKTVNEFLKDDGVKLVNEYAKTKKNLDIIKKEVEEKLDKLKEALIEFTKKNDVEVVVGSDNKVRVKPYESISFPAKAEREPLNKLIRDKGFWDELSNLDTFKLAKLVKENNLPEELKKDIRKFITKTESYRLSLGKKN
ncbi:MAG: PD-(D/E)XK nuclease family protein [Candidatus Woesearchaeota archaeon]|jgi:putative RecB family exonuclease|nr:hypothetical protein [archaeon]MDP6648412.1 PD-(D/E)XK nuclease family protein [Candidatus Woesearchaeota archaeon]|tara:strand:+ start:2144 stop:3331 length:1188 start_codon:yes stop_codon:yes gene_type:complete